MRELKSCDNNKITIYDPRSNEDITFFYRTPTTDEELSYISKLVQRATNANGKDIIVIKMMTRIDLLLDILTGFSDNSFCVDGHAISSDPKNKEAYCPEWKEFLKEGCSELLNVVAVTIFEGAQVKGCGMGIANIMEDDPHPLALQKK